jgi:hypothetical protein
MTDDDEPPPDSDEAIKAVAEDAAPRKVEANALSRDELEELAARYSVAPEELAEAQRLYAELLDEIAKGDDWGLNPEEDR